MTKFKHLRAPTRPRPGPAWFLLLSSQTLLGARALPGPDGAMPAGMSPGGMGAPHPSRPRNRRKVQRKRRPRRNARSADDAGPQAGYTNQHRAPQPRSSSLMATSARAPSC